MRNHLFLATLLAAGLAFAGPTTTAIQPSVTVESATQAAPTTESQGLSLRNVSGYRVSVRATGGTILGACWLRAYVYNEALKEWSRSAAADTDGNGFTDLEIKSVNIGRTTPLAFPDSLPVARVGRVFYATDGCTGGFIVVIEAVTL